MNTIDKINEIKLRFELSYNLPISLVDDILALNKMSDSIMLSKEKIKFKYVDNEYGEMAKELHQKHHKLSRAYQGDAGIDLPIVLSESEQKHGGLRIWSGDRISLHTGIIMEFPEGYWGRIIHRSSTEKERRLRIIEGVIDDYRGEILVQVHNQNSDTVEVYHGDRLGQIIIAKSCPFIIEYSDTLRESHRGSKGFGSSGTKGFKR